MAAPSRIVCRRIFNFSNTPKSLALLQPHCRSLPNIGKEEDSTDTELGITTGTDTCAGTWITSQADDMGIVHFQILDMRKKNTKEQVVRQMGLASKKTRPMLMDLWRRRLEQGPEPDRHRSVYPNWNYEAEIFAFGKRLGEEFNDATIRTAFIDKSFIEKEVEKRKELGVDSEDVLSMESNEKLSDKGEEITSQYIRAYLRHCLPALPEECIGAIHDFLTTEEMLSHISVHIGTKDLILCKEFPVSQETLKKTFHAVVGALAIDQGVTRAQLLVQDFVLTQLIDKELCNIISGAVHDPMGVLADVLETEGRGAPEPRLLFESAPGTLLATYQVGIYSDKQLLGRSFGETATIAEEMAARDALQRVWGTTLHMAPLPRGANGRTLDIDFNGVNHSLQDYKMKQIPQS